MIVVGAGKSDHTGRIARREALAIPLRDPRLLETVRFFDTLLPVAERTRHLIGKETDTGAIACPACGVALGQQGGINLGTTNVSNRVVAAL